MFFARVDSRMAPGHQPPTTSRRSNPLIMKTEFPSATRSVCIGSLSRRIDETISQRWQTILDQHLKRFDRLFVAQPEVACSSYLRLLFRPVAWRLAAEGLELYPGLPGGDPDLPPGSGDGPFREYWSVAAVCSQLDQPIGTLVTLAHFSTSRFDLRCKPIVFGSSSVGIATVRSEIQRRRENLM